MDSSMTWQVVVFLSFPEAILLTALGLWVIGARPRWYQIMLVGGVQSVSSYLIRQLPLVFGLHTVIYGITLALFVYVFIRLKFWIAFVSSILVLTFYIALESIILPEVIKIFNLSLPMILSDPWLRIKVFLPQALIVFILFLICKYYNFTLIPLVKQKTKEKEEVLIKKR